jgi:hypothetical protein
MFFLSEAPFCNNILTINSQPPDFHTESHPPTDPSSIFKWKIHGFCV